MFIFWVNNQEFCSCLRSSNMVIQTRNSMIAKVLTHWKPVEFQTVLKTRLMEQVMLLVLNQTYQRVLLLKRKAKLISWWGIMKVLLLVKRRIQHLWELINLLDKDDRKLTQYLLLSINTIKHVCLIRVFQKRHPSGTYHQCPVWVREAIKMGNQAFNKILVGNQK